MCNNCCGTDSLQRFRLEVSKRWLRDPPSQNQRLFRVSLRAVGKMIGTMLARWRDWRVDPELLGPTRHRSVQAQLHLTVILARPNW